MLHYAINRPVGAKWGESDLAPLLIWLSRYAAWLQDRARLNKYRQAFMYVVQGNYASDAERLARQAELNANPPSPGCILVTDASEIWTVLNPQLDSTDANADGLALKKMIAAGAGVPLHFLAEPEIVHPHHRRSRRRPHLPPLPAAPGLLPVAAARPGPPRHPPARHGRPPRLRQGRPRSPGPRHLRPRQRRAGRRRHPDRRRLHPAPRPRPHPRRRADPPGLHLRRRDRRRRRDPRPRPAHAATDLWPTTTPDAAGKPAKPGTPGAPGASDTKPNPTTSTPTATVSRQGRSSIGRSQPRLDTGGSRPAPTRTNHEPSTDTLQHRVHLTANLTPAGKFEILAITAGDGNGWTFPAAVLQKSLALWDKVECFVDHELWGHSMRRPIATLSKTSPASCTSPAWDDARQGIRAQLRTAGPSGPLLDALGREMLADADPKPDVGFSADVLFTAAGQDRRYHPARAFR